MSKVKKTEPHPFTLRAVYLRNSKQWMSEEFDPVLDGQPLRGKFRISGHQITRQEAVQNVPDAETIRSCRFTTRFEFRYLNTPLDNLPTTEEEELKYLAAEISAEITVDYLIGTPEIPSQEKLEQWASSNAVLHCWPYWREYCHSTLLRMNLPVTMIPMLEISHKKE